MKTESQEFHKIEDYVPSYEGNGEQIIYRLINTLNNELDYIYEDMKHLLGEETTDDAVEAYLQDTDHISKIIGFNFMEFDSMAEQEQEDELAWREICDCDDR